MINGYYMINKAMFFLELTVFSYFYIIFTSEVYELLAILEFLAKKLI